MDLYEGVRYVSRFGGIKEVYILIYIYVNNGCTIDDLFNEFGTNDTLISVNFLKNSNCIKEDDNGKYYSKLTC